MSHLQSPPAVFGDSTGMYRATILRSTADAARLTGEYNQADDMYHRGGKDRNSWIELSGSVLIERLGEDDQVLEQDVLLASEFNARFGFGIPVR